MPAARDPQPQVCRVRSGDAKLHVEVSGRGAPLVLIHGWALDHRVFAPQVEALRRHFRVITFDRRGFGLSAGEPDMRRELDDLDRLIDEVAGGPVHLLGMSQGGRIALRYAVTRPERLRGLILQGAAVDGEAPSGPDEERIPIAEYVALAKDGRLDEVRRRWAAHPMMQLGDDQAAAGALLARMLADYRGDDLIHFRPEAYRFPMDVLDAASRLALPTLVITGAGETVARRRQARRLVETIAGAREVVLPASGHLSNLTEPVAYNRAVREFCGRVDAMREASEGGAHD